MIAGIADELDHIRGRANHYSLDNLSIEVPT